MRELLILTILRIFSENTFLFQISNFILKNYKKNIVKINYYNFIFSLKFIKIKKKTFFFKPNNPLQVNDFVVI